VLLAAVEALVNAVKVELGERAAPKSPPGKRAVGAAPGGAATPDAAATTGTTAPCERVRACVSAMLRMNVSDHRDGSGRLFAAACRVVEHDLDDADGLAAVRDYARQRPFPNEWSDAEVVTRVRDAERPRTAPRARPPGPRAPTCRGAAHGTGSAPRSPARASLPGAAKRPAVPSPTLSAAARSGRSISLPTAG
jgi:hypothetical protein